MSRRARDFWGQAYAGREGVEYGPFDIDLEKVISWGDVFSYCEDDLRNKYLDLAQVLDKDIGFVKLDTGTELDWEDFSWNFDLAEHDDFFEDCCLSTGEYDWSKHEDLIAAYDTTGNDDDDTLEAIKAYLHARCSPEYFGQAYCGRYTDGASFAEDKYSEMIGDRELFQCLVINWEATWQGMYDYVEYGDGYFFHEM